LTGDELEARIKFAISECLAAGIHREAIVIRYRGLAWRWSSLIEAWDQFKENDNESST
jgi:hypothetical protein